MPRIVDLRMSDEEYLQSLSEGKNPLRQQLYEEYKKLLLSLGASPRKACQVAEILTSPIALWLNRL